jgi:hypothetical protein
MANITEPVNPGFPAVYLIDTEDDVVGGENGVSNKQGKQLTERTAYLKKGLEAEVVDRASADDALQGQVNTNREGVEANTISINAMKGRGGYLMAYDFGVASPTQNQLNDYALTQIHSDNHLDIWNGTHVKNLFDNHVWALTNTPDTDPPIHEWVDDGFDAVGIADQEKLGVVKGSEQEGYVAVEPVTGKMRLVLPRIVARTPMLPIISKRSPYAIASGKRSITLLKGTYIPVEVGNVTRWFEVDSNLVLNLENLLGGSLQAGKSYSVFLVPGASSFELAVDVGDVLDGYQDNQVRRICGFDTLCVDAGVGMTYVFGGITFDHLLNGYVAGDMLPASVWALNHRPFSDPKGMVYIDLLDFWCDIYFQSEIGLDTKSVYQGVITRNRQYVDFVEDQFCVRKSLLNDEEFATAMLGSNERTAVLGSSEAGATTGGAGGRKDTTQRRMISIYGVEEGCGSLWQWLATTSAAGGSGWWAQNGGKGDGYGGAYALLAGGGWSHAAYCGSRARDAGSSRAISTADFGGRGRSRPMRI